MLLRHASRIAAQWGSTQARRRSPRYSLELNRTCDCGSYVEGRINHLADTVTGSRDQAAHLKRRILETKRLIVASVNAPREVGPGKCCSPRHRIPFNSIQEGLKCVA